MHKSSKFRNATDFGQYLEQEAEDLTKPSAIIQKALGINPDSVEALNNLAWILSTQKNSVFRDGPKAVHLAHTPAKITGYQKPELLDTLAAAYAEAGRFHEASKNCTAGSKAF